MLEHQLEFVADILHRSFILLCLYRFCILISASLGYDSASTARGDDFIARRNHVSTLRHTGSGDYDDLEECMEHCEEDADCTGG